MANNNKLVNQHLAKKYTEKSILIVSQSPFFLVDENNPWFIILVEPQVFGLTRMQRSWLIQVRLHIIFVTRLIDNAGLSYRT